MRFCYCLCFCAILLVQICCVFSESTEAAKVKEDNLKNVKFKSIGRQLVEQGRTMVHHAVKRFMIIAPAIFFKLGIAFTLLIVVTLAVINNSFIGFLLLVVGLSSVLARLQETRRPVGPIAVPYLGSPLPPYRSWDRSDSSSSPSADYANVPVYYSRSHPEQAQTGVTSGSKMAASSYTGYLSQNQQYSPQLMSYYAKYGSNSA